MISVIRTLRTVLTVMRGKMGLTMASRTETRRRAGPKRSEASKEAILQAARHEMAESGWRAFSVDNVARRASASKQTIYRWWPSIASLCTESVMSSLPRRTAEATDAPGRICELIAPLVTFCRAHDGQHALRGAALAAADDDQARDVMRIWITSEVRGPLRLILAELAVKGSLRRDWDVDEAVAHLLGPIWYRVLVANAPLSDAVAREVSAGMIRAMAPS